MQKWITYDFQLISILGGDAAMQTCTYAFIADIATPEFRAMRMGLLSLTIMISYPIAMSLGSYLFTQGKLTIRKIQIHFLHSF